MLPHLSPLLVHFVLINIPHPSILTVGLDLLNTTCLYWLSCQTWAKGFTAANCIFRYKMTA